MAGVYHSAVHLFVYGTLLPETGNERAGLLAGAECLGPATIRGQLYNVGEYPAVVPGGEDDVHGQVFRVPDILLPVLDAVEFCTGDPPGKDDLFRRMRLPARLEGGGVYECVVYVWRRGLEGLTEIPHGDFLRFLGVR